MSYRYWGLLAALCLASCNQPTKAPEANRAAPAADSLATLRHLSAGSRSAVLFRAIMDAQSPCSKVTGSAYQQDYKGMAMFVAACPAAGPYAVFVSPTGYAQVSDCSRLGPGVPACRMSRAAGKAGLAD